MIVLVAFISMSVFTYYVGGLSKVTRNGSAPNFIHVWIFLIVTVLVTLAITGALISILLLGSAFSMPKGHELISLYAMMILTVLQCTLLWLTVFESVISKQALWGKYSLFLFITILLFLSMLLELNPYIYLVSFLTIYIFQLIYFRVETFNKRNLKSEL